MDFPCFLGGVFYSSACSRHCPKFIVLAVGLVANVQVFCGPPRSVSYWAILTRVFQRDAQSLTWHWLFENPGVEGWVWLIVVKDLGCKRKEIDEATAPLRDQGDIYVISVQTVAGWMSCYLTLASDNSCMGFPGWSTTQLLSGSCVELVEAWPWTYCTRWMDLLREWGKISIKGKEICNGIIGPKQTG